MRFDFSIFRVKREQTPKELRIGGAIMVILGLVIVVGGAALAWLVLDLPIPAHWLPAGTRIDRGPASEGPSSLQRAGQTAVTLTLLVFGTVSIVQGLLQLVLARQNRTLLRVMIVLAVLLVAAGVVASAIMGRPLGRVGQ